MLIPDLILKLYICRSLFFTSGYCIVCLSSLYCGWLLFTIQLVIFGGMVEMMTTRTDDGGGDDDEDWRWWWWWSLLLLQTNALCMIFKLLADWINGPQTNILLHSDTLSWIRTNQPLGLTFFLNISLFSSNFNDMIH